MSVSQWCVATSLYTLMSLSPSGHASLSSCVACRVIMVILNKRFLTYHLHLGFMQDNIIASHACFGGHTDVNC